MNSKSNLKKTVKQVMNPQVRKLSTKPSLLPSTRHLSIFYGQENLTNFSERTLKSDYQITCFIRALLSQVQLPDVELHVQTSWDMEATVRISPNTVTLARNFVESLSQDLARYSSPATRRRQRSG